MKVLHTSDWHLGHQLHQQKRDEEHRAFLEWLLQVIHEKGVELLLVAGDIFDTALPSNHALEMYYSFLARAAANGCREVIVVAGNHDSPATLLAPKPVLRAIHVTVVGNIVAEQPGNDLVEIRDGQGAPQALVCAVPHLRDRDVYRPKFGEPVEQRMTGIIEGTAGWYRTLADLALERRGALGVPHLPLIATGHLFTQGATKSGSERDLYVGDLGIFPAGRFPQEFSYVALGHLHRPQVARGCPNVRYSGSPLPCSFDEAAYDKKVFVFATESPAEVEDVVVPVFRSLVRVRGDLAALGEGLEKIGPAPLKPWVEVVYEDGPPLSDLEEKVFDLAARGAGQVLTIKDLSSPGGAIAPPPPLDELTPQQVFELCLEQAGTREEDRGLAREAFQRLLLQVQQGEVPEAPATGARKGGAA
ncbi:MAG: exonuclease subunit SbcD [Candidatus Riflebacteria bacterium]|nr:exonuclease subunit SbcD [Candidatus Riflebacteria bacterium]